MKSKTIPDALLKMFGEQDDPENIVSTFDFEAINSLLSRIADDAEKAQKLALVDSALQELMLMMRLVWSIVLKRDFTLVWNRPKKPKDETAQTKSVRTDGETPYSEATQFCYEVAKVIDDKIEVGELDYASRVIREKANDPKDLRDLPNFLDQMLNHLR